MPRMLSLIGAVVPCLIIACSHPPRDGQSSRNANEITEEEIAASSASNTYEAIRKLRPNFLAFRGKTSLIGTSNADPIVYVDDQAFGPISSLRTIPASQVASIRLYRSWEATTKFGMNNMGGVIAVVTKQ